MSEFTQAATDATMSRPILRDTRLVLFDFDGTLVDGAEAGAMDVMKPIIKRYFKTKLDVEVPDSYFEGMTGLTTEKVVEVVAAEVKTNFPDKKLEETDRKKLITELHQARQEQDPTYDDRVKAIAGAKDYLEFLRSNGIPFAIVTNSEVIRVKNFLAKAGLLEFFLEDSSANIAVHGAYRIVSAYDHCKNEGKPNPRPYKTAIDRYHKKTDLYGSSKGVVVFEDSVPGATAACAAGIEAVMGITASEAIKDKRKRAVELTGAGAARVFESYQEIQDSHGNSGTVPQPVPPATMAATLPLPHHPRKLGL